MPYKLGKIWNEANTYITTDKNVGINTNYPQSELDVKGDITEDGQKLKDKYTLKTDDNKKESLIVLDGRDSLTDSYKTDLILWYKFNENDFTKNYGLSKYDNDERFEHIRQNYITLTSPDIKFKTKYIIETNSAKVNDIYQHKIQFYVLGSDYNDLNLQQLDQTKYTICFWIYFNEIADKTILYSSKGDSINFKLSVKDNKLKFTSANNFEEFSGIKEFITNKWYHITIIIDMSTSYDQILKIYIDGTERYIDIDKILTRNIINKSNSSPIIYLGDSNPSESFDGYIDDFRIYETKLPLSIIQQDIIGNLTRITPGNISSLGNYGVDIVNFSNLVTVGNADNLVDLKIYGDLSVSNVKNSMTINENLTVNNDITENNQKLIDKYALKADIDKNTDVIISKMIDNNDVKTLYNQMPEFFRKKVLIEYNFDFDKEDIRNDDYFKQNSSTNPLINTDEDTDKKYEKFSLYNLQSNRNIEIDDYGEKYVKGRSSLKCESNINPLFYYFTTNATQRFTNTNNYTITLWLRLKEINRTQHIFKLGDKDYINLYVNDNNKLVFDNYTSKFYPLIIDENILKKDEWYHVTVLLYKESIIINNLTLAEHSDIIKEYEKEIFNYTYNEDTSNITHDPIKEVYNVLIYINGIFQAKKRYDENLNLFGNPTATSNYLGTLSDTDTDTDTILNGYIDDFKIFDQLIPIKYITENIIGNALILTPGQLSAIGNYGIDIKNFENLVTIGNNENTVDLNIYGTLMITNDNLSGSITTISSNILQTSNLTITDILKTNCNISENIKVNDKITGVGFILGNSNFIDTIQIDTLTTSNITTDIINVNSNLIVGNTRIATDIFTTVCNISQNIKVDNKITGNGFTLGNVNHINTINIDTLTNSNLTTSNITTDIINVNSRVVIGDHNNNNKRYDLNSYENENLNIPFSAYTNNFQTVSISEDINIYDKSFIFYGNSENVDIYFKDSYIRDSSCNIQYEMAKAHNEDRNRTRIKSDVGNIKLRNGFIRLEQYDVRSNNQKSLLTINEDSININDTTVLNSYLRLSNNDNYSLLTSSNFMFNNGYGFTNNETLRIHTIDLQETLIVPNLEDTDLMGNGKIDITNEIITTSNISASNLHITNLVDTSNINCSNITCENTTTVNTLVVKNNIILGDSTDNPSSGTGNSIDGGFGSLNITNITTDNITCKSNIKTDSLTCANILNFLVNDETITPTIVTYSNIVIDRINTTNTTSYAIDTFKDNKYGIVRCKLSSDSIIDVNDIKTSSINVDTIFSLSDVTFVNADITIGSSGITIKNSSPDYDLILDKNALKVYHADDNPLNKDIINYKFDITERDFITTIKCDNLTVKKLIVTNFDVGEDAFSFPNIISYDKNKNEDSQIPIPNIFIGHDKTADGINFDNNKDVLYIDTPEDSRLRCGNILVEKNINIGNTDNSLRISTGTIGGLENANSFTNNLYTTFTNKQLDSILVLSLTHGTVGINATPPISNDDNDDIKLFVRGGIQTSGDIIAFQSISDKRFKENIEPLNDDVDIVDIVDIVNKLNPVKFKWKDDLFNKTNAGKHDIGFIAQEIEELIPCAVSDAKIEFTETDYKYIKYERLIPYLVNNIKYLNNKIVELENKLK